MHGKGKGVIYCVMFVVAILFACVHVPVCRSCHHLTDPPACSSSLLVFPSALPTTGKQQHTCSVSASRRRSLPSRRSGSSPLLVTIISVTSPFFIKSAGLGRPSLIFRIVSQAIPFGWWWWWWWDSDGGGGVCWCYVRYPQTTRWLLL